MDVLRQRTCLQKVLNVRIRYFNQAGAIFFFFLPLEAKPILTLAPSSPEFSIQSTQSSTQILRGNEH